MSWTLTDTVGGVTYGCAASGSSVVTVGGGGVIRYSTDGGATWASASHSLGVVEWYDVCCTGVDEFVAVGTLSGNGYIAYSTDGGANFAWCYGLTGQAFKSCGLKGTEVVVGGQSGAIRYCSTSDYTTWSTGTIFAFEQLNAVGACTSYFLLGTQQDEIWSNDDASGSWTKKVDLSGSLFRRIVGNGDTAVALRYNGDVYYTTDDNTNWSSSTIDSGTFLGLASNGTNYIATATNGKVYRSNNITSWTQDSSTLSFDMYTACASDTYWILAGAGGNLYIEAISTARKYANMFIT